jgi:hypothetical protein
MISVRQRRLRGGGRVEETQDSMLLSGSTSRVPESTISHNSLVGVWLSPGERHHVSDLRGTFTYNDLAIHTPKATLFDGSSSAVSSVRIISPAGDDNGVWIAKSGALGRPEGINFSPTQYHTGVIQEIPDEPGLYSTTSLQLVRSLAPSSTQRDGTNVLWNETMVDGRSTSSPPSTCSSTTSESVWPQDHHQEATYGVGSGYLISPSQRGPMISNTLVCDSDFTSQSLEKGITISTPRKPLLNSPFTPPYPTASSTISVACTEDLMWPTDCYECRDPNEMFENNSQWLFHVFTAHDVEWRPTFCLWKDPPCTKSKTEFPTKRLWLEHARIVHQKSYYCDENECKSQIIQKAFGTHADVRRHKQMKHQLPVFCNKRHCKGKKTSKLNRKDKRDEHELKWHGHISCNVGDCRRRRIDGVNYGFSTQKALAQHQRESHHRITGDLHTIV